jgi:DNA-binding CsgD family transcriptional regulator
MGNPNEPAREKPSAEWQAALVLQDPSLLGPAHPLTGIAETDMRAIVRLLGETAAIRGDLLQKKHYLLDGLCDLIGAQEWRWEIVRNATAVSAETRACALRHQVSSRPIPLETSNDDPDSLALPPATPHIVLSTRALSDIETSRLALIRTESEPAFTPRELQLASLTLDEIPWLHFRQPVHNPAHPRLSPRLQYVLDLLLLGLSRKEISALAGISPGTVGGYVRELYAHFRVNSHAEFMRLHLRNPRP